MTVLFVAPNPHSVAAHDGFLQRVAAIDHLFEGWTRLYYDDVCQDANELAVSVHECDLIYIHSIYHAKRILALLPHVASKVILDIHGAVPEEVALFASKRTIALYEEVEQCVFSLCKVFVAVSDSMVDHFVLKYPSVRDAKWIKLPIFTEAPGANAEHQRSERAVIYSGGVQPWQNVDLMIDVIKNAPTVFTYSILTQEPEAFSELNSLDRVVIRTVSSEDVYSYCLRASMGFMLRNDCVVNRVACPTKLIEYIQAGVVPILLSPDIGDFKALGLRYIQVEDFRIGSVRDDYIKTARGQNVRLLSMLRDQTIAGTQHLLAESRAIATVAQTLSPPLTFIRRSLLKQSRSDAKEKFINRISRVGPRIAQLFNREPLH